MVSQPADTSFPVTRCVGMLTEGSGKEVHQPEASSASDLPGDLEPLLCFSPGLGFPICEVGGWRWGRSRDGEEVGLCGLQVCLRAMFLGAAPDLLKFHGLLSNSHESDFGGPEFLRILNSFPNVSGQSIHSPAE